MRDIKKTKIAKDWIFQLANGINPIDGTDLSDTDIVNIGCNLRKLVINSNINLLFEQA